MPRGFVNRRDRFRWDNVHFPDGENPLSSDSVTYDGQTLTQSLDRLKEGVCFVDATPGASVSFITADAAPLKKLTAVVTLSQSGSGDPAPDNVRTITGYSSCTITVTDGVTPTTYTVSFGDAGTVYGGTLDVISGVLTVDKLMIDLGDLDYTRTHSGITTEDGFIFYAGAFTTVLGSVAPTCEMFKGTTTAGSNNAAYNKGDLTTCFSVVLGGGSRRLYIRYDAITDVDALKTAVNGVKLVYHLIDSAKLTYQLTPQEVETLVGSNTVSASTGDITALTYQDTFTNEVNLIWQAIAALQENRSITPPPDDQRKAVTEEPAEEIVEEQPVKKTTRKKSTNTEKEE